LNPIIENLYQEEIYHINKQVLIVVNRPWNDIQDNDKVLLSKILASVKVNIDAVRILHSESITLHELNAADADKVLVFGSKVRESVNDFEHTIINGISLIKADELSRLDDLKKKSLWGALKHMFSK
jgi:DNA polymerase III psi subunit